jgi:hypothetical protein
VEKLGAERIQESRERLYPVESWEDQLEGKQLPLALAPKCREAERAQSLGKRESLESEEILEHRGSGKGLGGSGKPGFLGHS